MALFILKNWIFFVPKRPGAINSKPLHFPLIYKYLHGQAVGGMGIGST
jgi:hypothetical protein